MSQIFAQQRGGGGNLFLGGSKISDQDIRDQNGASLSIKKILHIVLATQSISNVVKSSLGPVGLDKMLVDDIGVLLFERTFVTIGCNSDK
jgi:T-complex protein 1 subunit alpha